MQISLPIFQDQERPQTCADRPDRCKDCPIRARGECPGCSAIGGLKRCRMANCDTNCGRCGGYKVEVPAVCWPKSPMRNLVFDKLKDVRWDRIPKGRTLDLAGQSVMVIAGGKRPVFRSSIDQKRYESVRAIGVSMRMVWSKRGWISNDLKDYLGIPNRVKLILTTTIYDDYLETATDGAALENVRERPDIDLFMPLQYSSYNDDSGMQEWMSWKRTLRSMEDQGGDFCFGDMDLPMLKDTEHIAGIVPQVVFYPGISDSGLQIKQRQRIYYLHKKLPRNVSFWFVGPSSESKIRYLKRLIVGRPAVYLSATPWMVAHKGKEFSKAGKHVPDRTTPQDELTARAFENFKWLVDNVA